MLDTITIPPKQFTALTASAVEAIRIHNLGPAEVLILGTATAAAPSSLAGAQPLGPGHTLLADTVLAGLFPNVEGGSMYLHAYSETEARLSISHA